MANIDVLDGEGPIGFEFIALGAIIGPPGESIGIEVEGLNSIVALAAEQLYLLQLFIKGTQR